jgi:hypothetical protein
MKRESKKKYLKISLLSQGNDRKISGGKQSCEIPNS